MRSPCQESCSEHADSARERKKKTKHLRNKGFFSCKVYFYFLQEEESLRGEGGRNGVGGEKAVFFFLKTEFYFIQGKKRALKKQKITEEQTNKKKIKSKKEREKKKNISTEIFPKRVFLQKRKTEQASLGYPLNSQSRVSTE